MGGEPSFIAELVVRIGVGAFTSIPGRIERITAAQNDPNANYYDVGIETGALLVLVLDMYTPSP